MNGPIRRVSLVVMLMFLALVVNLSYAYVFRTESLNADPANRRVRVAQFGVDRGDILVGNTPVVTSVPVETRFSFQRTYSSGELYASVTGFYSFMFGGTGLEQYYSARLAGTDDAQFLQNLVNTATGKRPQGDSLQTTLDARAQRAAAQGLGKRPGAVVALDYTTGEIKALVSTPSFDPNELSSHDLNATQAAWARLNSDPARPMANRAVREIFPPGSTFKLVVAAAALESGMTPETMVDSPSTLRLPGSTFEMTGSCGGEQITLKQALRVSCNTAFANVGSQLGADALRRQAQRFGFGSTQLPELSGVASRFPANPDAAQTMLSSIGGFDVAASPLQMAMVAAAIANDGVLMEPHLVSQMRGPDLGLPDLSDDALMATLDDWLQPAFAGKTRLDALGEDDLANALKSGLDWSLRQRIDALAPTRITVPSGMERRIEYAHGQPPVLAVKLQELFGLADTPRVADDRVPVLLHLLSPGGKPLQVTSDLRNFWNSTYAEVKKEMKGRYPKHPWPDDPWSARATHRAKPRGT